MKFKIMGQKGDDVYDYDVETAEVKFNELLSASLLPVALDGSGDKKIIKKFNPEVEEITWIPKIIGG